MRGRIIERNDYMADLFYSFRRLDGRYRVKYAGPCSRGDSLFTYELRSQLHMTLLHICHYVIDYCVEKGQTVTVNLIGNEKIEIVGYGPWYKSEYGHTVRVGEIHNIWLEKED